MNKKPSSCAICEYSNRASICANCVNYRLGGYHNLLKSLKGHRDQLYSRLSEVLVAKEKADHQNNWRVIENEKLASLTEKLCCSKEQIVQGNAKIERMSCDLKVKYEVLESAHAVLQKNHVEQLEKSYPNLIHTLSQEHKNLGDYNFLNPAASFLHATDISDVVKYENVADEWELVEYPPFPPPPACQTEDVKHWTRAMFKMLRRNNRAST